MLPREAPQPAGGQEADVLPGLRLTNRTPAPAAFSAALATGLLLTLANPPADLGPVAFVALVPLLWAMTTSRPRRAALLGFVAGAAYYGVLVSWQLILGWIAWLPLVVSQAAWLGLFGWLAPRLWRARRPFGSALMVAALWTAIDWARSTWPVGGFTFGGLGYTQHANHPLLPLASVTGVWGVTFVVAAVNALVLAIVRLPWRTRRTCWRTALRLAAAGLAITLLPAVIPLPAANGRHLDVAVVQGNVPRSLAADRLLQSQVVAANHIRLNRELAADPPGLVVWPENSVADDPTVDRALGAAVSASIRDVGVPTIVGGIADAPGGAFYNEAFLYDPNGAIVDRYAKIHLVPFGEYVPYPSLFGWVQRYRQGLGDLVAGHRIVLFPVDGAKVATPICFENTFPDLFRRFVDAGANLVVVTTNDSTYLDTVLSREHVIMSQLRAVENGRWVVQAAISGESAVIDPRGVVVRHTGLFVPAIMRYDVPESSARTLYTRLGDWFPWACGFAALIALAVWALRRRRRLPAPPAGEGGASPGGGDDAGGDPTDARRAAPIAGGADPSTLVVLPTYNERHTIERAVRGALAAGPDVHVAVVDDGSPDGTGALVAAIASGEPRVRLISRATKQGLASAYLRGFAVGLDEGFEVIVEMDADLSHDPADLPALLAAAADHDLAIGSRYIPGGGVSNWSRGRLALSRAGNAYARVVLGLPVHDATSGYRAYRAKSLAALIEDGISSEGYGFQVELVYRAAIRGMRIAEVPITFRERAHGHSKLSRAIVAEALVEVARWGIRDRVLPRLKRR
ncbi:MAG TPA: apolipoprotein N-acyltransferase [Actinomycetota bacterium]